MESALDLIRPMPAESKADLRYKVHYSLSNEVAVITEPVATALQILEQIDINQDHPEPETWCWPLKPSELYSQVDKICK